MKTYQEQSFYELLEVEPEASADEIRAAYDRMRRLCATDGLALYGLASESEGEELHARLNEAIEVLTHWDRRREYNQSLGLSTPPQQHHGAASSTEQTAPSSLSPSTVSVSYVPSASGDARREGPPVGHQLGLAPELAQEAAIGLAEAALAKVSAHVRDQPRAAAPQPPNEPAKPRSLEIPPEAEFNGELLRRVRESRSLTISLLAERTRISQRHLENIEADRYGDLPAAVYLRGMLMNLAREYGLDPIRVSKSYLGLVAHAKP